jgi:hypothetical protein
LCCAVPIRIATASPPAASPSAYATQKAFKNGELAKAVKRIAKRQQGREIQLWYQDEACVGQRVRNAHVWFEKGASQMVHDAHVWFEKGARPVLRTDRRFRSVYIYGTVRRGDDAFALVPPRADGQTTRLSLGTFGQSLPPNVRVVQALDRGSHPTTSASSLGGRIASPADDRCIRKVRI